MAVIESIRNEETEERRQSHTVIVPDTQETDGDQQSNGKDANNVSFHGQGATPQLARDVPGTYPEGPLNVLTSGTSKGPSGDSQGTNAKIDDLMKKLFFRCSSPCFTHLFLTFTEKSNFQKF